MKLKYYSGVQVMSIIEKLPSKEYLEILNAFAEEPSADVRENIHAHWDKVEMKMGEWWHTCSKCKATWGSEDGELDFNYCPNCGADMRERRTDDDRS